MGGGRIATAGVLLACMAAATAEEALPDPRALGLAEAMRGFCRKAAPALAVHQEARVRRLVEGVSDAALDQARRSPAYRQAYAAQAAFAEKIDQRNLRRACYTTGAKPKEAP